MCSGSSSIRELTLAHSRRATALAPGDETEVIVVPLGRRVRPAAAPARPAAAQAGGCGCGCGGRPQACFC